MEIRNIRKEIQDESASLLADIVFRGKTITLFFSVDTQHRDFLVQDATPFIAALTIPAMALGENLIVHGSISKKVLVGAERIIKQLLQWRGDLKETVILPDDISVDVCKQSRAACFFSGGLDSFYTVFKYLDGERGKLSHLIFVNGFDMNEEQDPQLIRTVRGNISATARGFGLEAIFIRTNLRKVLDQCYPWAWTHGGALASVALALRDGFSRIAIASTRGNDQLIPWGSHPLIDPNWSSEALEIFYDEDSATRVQKAKRYIIHSELALTYLHVCYRNVRGQYNCGKCGKCIRTMAELRAAGLAGKAPTFPEFNIKLLQTLDLRKEEDRDHISAILDELIRDDRDYELQDAIREVLANAQHVSIMRRIRDAIGRLDQKYNHGRLYKFLSRAGMVH